MTASGAGARIQIGTVQAAWAHNATADDRVLTSRWGCSNPAGTCASYSGNTLPARTRRAKAAADCGSSSSGLSRPWRAAVKGAALTKGRHGTRS
ncbi:conserved hypothetical protein [Streptomyces clavuligerus]|uniref:Uncharacterized protein n=1 Tax=Streptomyces clavuligerus TaxID=1901 RepID=Q6TMR6_STRCL|nr:hypothetical protein pSCL2.6.A8.3 [Streptomyces clavuligerus]EDY48729.1 conserved hypothetical protein [Streptomyces clavuligerus]